MYLQTDRRASHHRRHHLLHLLLHLRVGLHQRRLPLHRPDLLPEEHHLRRRDDRRNDVEDRIRPSHRRRLRCRLHHPDRQRRRHDRDHLHLDDRTNVASW